MKIGQMGTTGRKKGTGTKACHVMTVKKAVWDREGRFESEGQHGVRVWSGYGEQVPEKGTSLPGP